MRSRRKSTAPTAPAAQLRAVTGATKLTFSKDKAAKSAKNATAIMARPTHIQPTAKAFRINRINADGRKSVTSPICFMARVTQSSPPVPATTMTQSKRNSRTLGFDRSGAGRSVSHDEYSQANHGDAQPTQRRDHFTEQEVAEQRDHGIGKGRSGLQIAIVRPG